MVTKDECKCPRDQRVYCHVTDCQGGADLRDGEEVIRFVRAALRMMTERVPDGTALMAVLLRATEELNATYPPVTDPPWSTEPDGPAVARPWSVVCEGDWVRGGDKAFYLIKANRPSNGEQHVTIQVKGQDRTYPRQARVFAQVKRGPVGMAMDVLEQVGLGPKVLASGD